MKLRASLLAASSLLLVAACGSAVQPAAKQAAATPRPSPKQAVLASIAKTDSSSFVADMSVSATISATGPGASLLGPVRDKPLTATMQLSAENGQRMRLTLDTSVAGRSVTAVAVVYDGTAYISADGGTTYKQSSVGAVSNQFDDINTLSYLQSVGTVTDEGPGTADGVAVERYSAQLDGAKVLKLVQASLGSSQTSAVRQLAGSMTFNGGALEVTVDRKGRIITEHGPIDASVDLGGFAASLAGTRMTIHEVIDGHFHDYGGAITVTRPSTATVSSN